MKKKIKKLQLSKETVRNLTNNDVKKAAGGSSSECTFPATCCYSCRVWCTCEC